MTRREAILAAGPYYHVTSLANVSSIMEEGLVPEKWDEGNYSIADCVKKPMMCIAPAMNKTKYISMILDNAADKEVALLEIAADAVADLECELDCTNTELGMRVARLKTDDFATLLLDGADLMCFDTILPCHITDIGHVSKG